MIDPYLETLPTYAPTIITIICIVILVLAGLVEFYSGYLFGKMRTLTRLRKQRSSQAPLVTTEYNSLIKTAKEQRQQIDSLVKVESIIQFKNDVFEGRPYYFIAFALRVSNISVFPITFEKDLGNRLTFDGIPFDESPRFFEDKIPVIPGIVGGTLRIEQRLSKAEADSIVRAMDRHDEAIKEHIEKRLTGIPVASRIGFKDLILNIKSEDDAFPKVESKEAWKILETFDVSRHNLNYTSAKIRNPDKVEIEALQGKVTELTQELEDTKKKKYEDFQADWTRLDKMVKENEVIINKAYNQRITIDRSVRVEDFYYFRPFQPDKTAKDLTEIVLGLTVRNESYFEVYLNPDVTGYFEHQGQIIGGQTVGRLERLVWPEKKLAPQDFATYQLHYRVSKDEFDYLNKTVFKLRDGNKLLEFNFDNLQIMIQSDDKSVKEKKLRLGTITAYNK